MKRGYSLIEVLISLALLAMVGLGLLSLFVSARTASETGLGSASAASVAAGELDRATTLPYNELSGYLTAPMPSYNVTVQSVPYSIQVTVTRVGTAVTQPEYLLLDVRLQASWMEKQALDAPNNAAAQEVTRSVVCHSVVGPESSL